MASVKKRWAVVLASVLVVSGCYKTYDFDANGDADVVWLDTTGTWHQDSPTANGPTDLSGTPTVLASDSVPAGSVAFGVVGNYDAGPKEELAIVTLASTGWFLPGVWSPAWVTHSSAGTITFAPPPDTGRPNSYSDKISPVPGKYDGGGKTIPAWYRDFDGTWFIQGHDPIPFGSGPTNTASGPSADPASQIDQDLPVPADYDGDGTTDLAVYSPRTGRWRIRNSKSGTVSSFTLGGPGWLPAPADFDGVHHIQAAVFDAASAFATPIGSWQIEGHTPAPPEFTDPGTDNVPAVADYDGDGKADLASVFDFDAPSARWHVHWSSAAGLIANTTVAPGMVAFPAETNPAIIVNFPRLLLLYKDLCVYNMASAIC